VIVWWDATNLAIDLSFFAGLLGLSNIADFLTK
jgi:hypothetical protein